MQINVYVCAGTVCCLYVDNYKELTLCHEVDSIIINPYYVLSPWNSYDNNVRLVNESTGVCLPEMASGFWYPFSHSREYAILLTTVHS